VRTPALPRRFLFACVIAMAVGVTTTGPAAADPSPSPSASPSQSEEEGKVRVSYAPAGTGISGQFIVRLRNGASAAKKAAKYRSLHRYSDAVNGFAAKLSSTELSKLQSDRDVTAIEQDRIFRATVMPSRAITTQSSPPYSLDRIDQRSLPLNHKYTYASAGSGTNVYIIDTGIQTLHPQFGGRASVAYDAVGDGWNGQDCNGHGTHVAGIVGSNTYGVAKSARLYSVRVLDCDGYGSLSGVIAGVNWVKAHKGAKPVANMSLGGSKSTSLNDAVTALSKSGVFLAVAAGNEGQNACNTSPASAGWVEATGAVSATDTRRSWSNYGSCVDIHAPGVLITSTWLGGGTERLSGTSMASPHVAGVAALYKAVKGNASLPTIQTWLHANAGAKVNGLPSGTPNRLLFKSTL
jgi:subtilisin family serine protease